MEILSAQFVKGVAGSDDIFDDPRQQIAFVGRSNVGKSSLMNSLLGRKDLVKSSNKPGKTQRINFFSVEVSPSGESTDSQGVYFVDLPGYGYAKLGDKQRDKIRNMIVWYLTSDEIQKLFVVALIDAKVGPTTHDIELIELLEAETIPHIIVANKMDKLNQKDLHSQRKKFEDAFDGKVFFYSATKHRGRDAVLDEIETCVLT